MEAITPYSEQYSKSLHISNLALTEEFIETAPVKPDNGRAYHVTPWLVSADGIVRVKQLREDGSCHIDIVQQISKDYYDLPPHTLKHSIHLSQEFDIRSKTKLYLPFTKNPGLVFFNRPFIEGRLAKYPSDTAHNPIYASRLIRTYLNDGNSAELAQPTDLNNLFTLNSWLLRYIAGVKLDTVTIFDSSPA